MKGIGKSRYEGDEIGESNYVAFDNAKDEIITFRRTSKPELRRTISETRITVCRHTINFNTVATRWL